MLAASRPLSIRTTKTPALGRAQHPHAQTDLPTVFFSHCARPSARLPGLLHSRPLSARPLFTALSQSPISDPRAQHSHAPTNLYTVFLSLLCLPHPSVPQAYFKDGWNRFDFVLVLTGVLDAALSFLHTGFLRVLRVFRLQRLLRVMRLVRKSKVGR